LYDILQTIKKLSFLFDTIYHVIILSCYDLFYFHIVQLI